MHIWDHDNTIPRHAVLSLLPLKKSKIKIGLLGKWGGPGRSWERENKMIIIYYLNFQWINYKKAYFQKE